MISRNRILLCLAVVILGGVIGLWCLLEGREESNSKAEPERISNRALLAGAAPVDEAVSPPDHPAQEDVEAEETDDMRLLI